MILAIRLSICLCKKLCEAWVETSSLPLNVNGIFFTGNDTQWWFVLCVFRLFSDDEIKRIRNVTLRTIMTRNIRAAWFRSEFLQDDVFAFNRELDDPSGQCSAAFETYTDAELTSALEPCSAMRTFDYFSGSELPYIFTICALVAYFLLNVVVLYLAIHWAKRGRRKRSLVLQNDAALEVLDDSLWINEGAFSDSQREPLIAKILEVSFEETVMFMCLWGPAHLFWIVWKHIFFRSQVFEFLSWNLTVYCTLKEHIPSCCGTDHQFA